MDRYQVNLSFHKKKLRFWCKGQDFIIPIKKNRISFASSKEEYKINMAIIIQKQVNQQLNQNY